jgi:hypothetical protein
MRKEMEKFQALYNHNHSSIKASEGLATILNQQSVGQLRGGGGVNQLLPCLNNYASFKNFTRHSMMMTIMQGNKR